MIQTLSENNFLVNNSRMLRYFINVFLETVVEIAMLWFDMGKKKIQMMKIGPILLGSLS